MASIYFSVFLNKRYQPGKKYMQFQNMQNCQIKFSITYMPYQGFSPRFNNFLMFIKFWWYPTPDTNIEIFILWACIKHKVFIPVGILKKTKFEIFQNIILFVYLFSSLMFFFCIIDFQRLKKTNKVFILMNIELYCQPRAT